MTLSKSYQPDYTPHSIALQCYVYQMAAWGRDDSQNLKHVQTDLVVKDQVYPYSLVRVVKSLKMLFYYQRNLSNGLNFHVKSFHFLVPMTVVELCVI